MFFSPVINVVWQKQHKNILSGLQGSFCFGLQQHSQLPLVDGDGRVGVGAARQLHILAVQVPVSIEALDLHVRFICKKSALKSAISHMTQPQRVNVTSRLLCNRLHLICIILIFRAVFHQTDILLDSELNKRIIRMLLRDSYTARSAPRCLWSFHFCRSRCTSASVCGSLGSVSTRSCSGRSPFRSGCESPGRSLRPSTWCPIWWRWAASRWPRRRWQQSSSSSGPWLRWWGLSMSCVSWAELQKRRKKQLR